MRPFLGLMFCVLLGALLAAGCGPAVPPEDLGTVVDEVPEVGGAKEPYEMPELGPPVEVEAVPDEPDESHAGG